MIRRMLTYVGYLVPVLIFSWFAGLIAELGQVFVAWQAGRLFISGSQSVRPLLWWLIGGILIAAIGAFAEQYAGHYVAFKVLADLRNVVYAKVQRLAPAGLDNQRSGDLLKAVGDDIEAMEVFYAHTIVPIAIGAAFTLVLAVTYAWYDLVAGLLVLAASILVGGVLPLYRYRRLRTANARLAQVQGETQQQMLEAVRGRDALLQLHAAGQKMAAVDAQYQQEGPAQQAVGVLNDQKGQLAWLVIIGTWLALAAWLGVRTHFSLAVLPLLLAFPFAFRPLLALANLPDSLSKGLGATKRVFVLLDTPEPNQTDGTQALTDNIADVQVDHLTYAYPNRAQTVLQDVSLQLRQGQIGGIVGVSGAGKSTLAKLLMKWYPAPKGTIAINGVDAADWQTATVWQEINYLPQRAQIFHATVRENLQLGEKNLTGDAIKRVLAQVKLTERIDRLPMGLDTVLNADSGLSAGEQQRLALARAFLHPSSLLILDEPTSNLDVINEQIILNSIRDYYPGMVLMITHREETLGFCDVVWRLADGQLTVEK